MTEIKRKIKTFFEKGRLLRYGKRQIILHPGDIPQGSHYIIKGYARLYTVSTEGKELTLVNYGPGEVFPVVYTVKGQPSIYYFESLTKLELYRVPREEFVKFLHENTDVFHEFTRGITSRFQITLKRMEYLAFGNAHARVASIFMILAERFGEEKYDTMMIQIPLTHKDIAALLGITRETVTIEVNKLKDKKLIAVKKGHYCIINPAGLRKESLLED